MARSTITVAYLSALVAFVTRLEKHQAKTAKEVEGEPEFRGLSITIESGNKYDKVVRNVSRARPANPEKTRTKSEVIYFVDKVTGNVFGARSDIAPNEKRFAGHITNASKWDWHGETAMNMTDDSVEEIGEYAGVKHYAPVKVKRTAVTAAVVAPAEEVAVATT
jgi:hypothetical protein